MQTAVQKIMPAELDYIEDQGRRNAAFSLETLNLLHQRAHTMLTLLLGGAGAAGGVALGGVNLLGNGWWTAWGLGTVAVWWFLLAAVLAVYALKTKEIRAPAGQGKVLLDHLEGPLTDYVKQARVSAEAEPPERFVLLRIAEIKTLQSSADGYRRASAAIAKTLDWVYRLSAGTPLIAAIVLSAVYVARK